MRKRVFHKSVPHILYVDIEDEEATVTIWDQDYQYTIITYYPTEVYTKQYSSQKVKFTTYLS